MSWGVWGKSLDIRRMADLIDYCTSQGITTFDHADIYGGYSTEAEFGDALKESGIDRSAIQLVSKCGIQLIAPTRKNNINHYEYSKEYIIWSVNNSLKNLKTDYLDLLLIHRPSPLMNPYEIGLAINHLKDEGKIKDFGVSNFTVSQMSLLSTATDISVNQIEFSATKFEAMMDGTLDYMFSKDITPMAWAPLGTYFKEPSEQTERISKVLISLSDKYNADPDQLLLAWIMKHPSGVHPVIGTTNKERITKAIESENIHIDLQDWFKIWVASQGHDVP